MKIRILMADDHSVVRQGLRTALEKEPDMVVVAEADNGRQAVAMSQEHKPDLILMDIRMPELNGTEATRRIIVQNPGIKVLALSMITTRQYVIDMLEAGASGFLPKNCQLDELLSAIRTVMNGKSYLSSEVTGPVIETMRKQKHKSMAQRLSNREREVMQLVAEGFSSRNIAERLNISEATVDTHRRNLMRKLGLHNMADLIRFALREGITDLDT